MTSEIFFKSKRLFMPIPNFIGIFILVLICFGFLVSCKGDDMEKINNMNSAATAIEKEISDENLALLNKKKIFFGHQSVGFNIVDGINKLGELNPKYKLNIVELGEFEKNDSSFFVHYKIGKNRKPLTKIKAFSNALTSSELGDGVDIAFMKFCYVDINRKTDIDEVFDNYQKEVESLKAKYPNTTFVHVTTPLKTVQTGIIATAKKILGKPAGGYESNIMRNKYNKRLFEEFGGKDPIFDLARVEASRPDGSLQSFSYDGQEYLSLYPKYTKDGGHLNEKGQIYVAENLLKMLTEIN